MADVITRFKLETTQYDSKLRDAAKGLKEIVHLAELGGKGFNDFSQKSVEAARALGTVASGANTAKDKVKDLVGAYNEAARAYNNLTKEQQQSDFGKAMAQSLTQLSDRIREAKSELYGLEKTIKDVHSSSGLFGEGGFTGMLQVAGGNLLAEGITKLGSEMVDAIQRSVELARAGEGVRNAFERLNQPNLLDKLKEATHGTVSEVELMKQAIKFENFKLPLEDLATYLAFAQQKAKDTGESVDYMVNSITTGLGRQSKQILDNLGISAAELTRRMNEGADMTKAVADIIREEMAKAGDYVETAADRAAQAAAKAADEMEAFGRSAAPVAEEWGKLWNSLTIGAMEFANTLLGPVASSIRSIQNILYEGPNGETYKDRIIEQAFKNLKGTDDGKWSGTRGFTPDYQKVTAPGGYIEITDANTGAVIGGQHFNNLQDTNVINAWRKSLNKSPKSGKSNSNLPEYFDFSKLLTKNESVDLKKQIEHISVFDMFKDQAKFDPENILGSKDNWEAYKDTITGTISEMSSSLAGNLSEVEGFNELLNNLSLDGFIESYEKVGEEVDGLINSLNQQHKAFGLAASAANAFGAALQGIEDPAAKAAGTVTQAVASIALGFAMASSNANTAGTGWGWLAWLGAGMSAMATTIATVHSLTGYQNGGMIKGYSTGGTIKGNSYSGDNIGGLVDGSQLVGLNSGEIVLNKAQQATLAQNLQGSGNGAMRVVGEIQGEKIVLVANRYFRRTGQGEIVTW